MIKFSLKETQYFDQIKLINHITLIILKYVAYVDFNHNKQACKHSDSSVHVIVT